MDLIHFLYFSLSYKKDRLNSDINYAHKCKTKKTEVSKNNRNRNNINNKDDDDDDDNDDADKRDKLLKSADCVPPVLDFIELKRNY